MLKEIFLITEFKFTNPGSGKFEDQILKVDTSQVVKTCKTIQEADSFITLPENAHRVLVALPAWEVPNSRQLHFLNHNTKYMQKIDIAKAVWSACRAHDISAGLSLLPAWDDLPDTQRQEQLQQVEFYIANSGLVPQQVHKQWLNEKAVQGWGNGPLYDPTRKQDPCIAEFDQLPVEKKFRYNFIPQMVALMKMFLPPDVVFDRDEAVVTPNAAAAAPPNLIPADKLVGTVSGNVNVVTVTGAELLAGKESTEPASMNSPSSGAYPDVHVSRQSDDAKETK